MTLVKAVPVKTVAAYVGENDTRLWRIVHLNQKNVALKIQF